MKIRPKQAYHPFVSVAFYLQILPQTLRTQIPRTTLYDWQHKNVAGLFGYDWYCQHKHLFDTLQAIAVNNRLLQVNKALLRIVAMQKFLIKHAAHIRYKIFNAAETVLTNIKKISKVLGLSTALKWLRFSRQQYWQLLQKTRCSKSVFNLCLPKHPSQLLQKEINIIREYCRDTRYLHWPLASVYHQIIRDEAVRFCISTFYKYTSLLKLKRNNADVTVFRTADNSKRYIYMLQDNFSRTILQYAVKKDCRAAAMMQLLKSVHDQYLHPASIEVCQLMTDDGNENYGVVQDFLQEINQPTIQHIVAQHDVEFSNSMIEAANKNIKYRFLYHKHIPDFEALCRLVPLAINDFNNRPHAVLSGLTPTEVLNGKQIDKPSLSLQMNIAKAERMITNKEQKCCQYSF